jgi:SNF2 family DNA or RNA helicase
MLRCAVPCCAQVLKDLPPKIIQDVLCEPSPLQKALYEDFAHSQVRRALCLYREAAGSLSILYR